MRTLFVLLAILLAAPAQAQLQDILRVTTEEVAPGMYSHGSYSRRSVFWVTRDGVIATDPVNPAFAAEMRDAIAAVTDKPVTHLIYSHQHYDHSLGGQIFRDEGAELISHANCIAHWERVPHPDQAMPDWTFSETTALTVGDTTIDLRYHGLNHGDCMIVMQRQGTPILFVGDLVTPFSVGLGMMPDYYPGEWIRTLTELEALDGWDQMIGNHGVPIAPKAALVQRRDYLKALLDYVSKAHSRGLRAPQMIEEIDLPDEIEAMRGYDLQIARAVERMYYFVDMGW